jgi:putative membrane protein
MSSHGGSKGPLIDPNLATRLFGTIAVLVLFIQFVPGFHAVDFFTLAVVAVGIALIELPLRPFIELQTLIFTPITIGVPLFVVTFILLFLLAQVFPGFSINGYWQIPLASLAVALVHVFAERYTHSVYQNK